MSGSTTEHRAFRVASVNGLSSILAIGMQLVTVPICLKYWGKETYGAWLALFSVFAMLQTTGGGFVNYVGNRINLLYHQGHIALQQTLSSSLAGVFILAAIQLALVLSVIGFDILARLIGTASGTVASHSADWALLVLAGSWMLGGFYFGIIHRLLIPAGMMYQAAWWALGSQFSLFIAVIVSAFFQFTLLQTSALFAVTQFLFVFASALYIRAKLPQYYPWWRGFRFAHGLRDLLRSIPLTASGLIQQGSSNGLVVLASAVVGAATVPVFTTVRTLANLWTNVTNVLTTPLLPDVVRFHAKSEGPKLIAVHEAHGVIVGSAVNLSILLAYPLIPPLYKYWTHHAVALDKVLLCTLLASVSLMNLGAMMNTYLTGINHHRTILSTAIARGAVSLVFGGAMLAYIGIGGLGLGVLVGELVAFALLVYFFNKSVRMHLQTYPNWLFSGPAFLSVASVQFYLAVEALGAPAPFLYPIAVAGTLLGAAWGWRRLDGEIRNRLARLAGRRFGVKKLGL